jgi:hypothetical protein
MCVLVSLSCARIPICIASVRSRPGRQRRTPTVARNSDRPPHPCVPFAFTSAPCASSATVMAASPRKAAPWSAVKLQRKRSRPQTKARARVAALFAPCVHISACARMCVCVCFCAHVCLCAQPCVRTRVRTYLRILRTTRPRSTHTQQQQANTPAHRQAKRDWRQRMRCALPLCMRATPGRFALSGRVHVGAVREQPRHHRRMPALSGSMERHEPVAQCANA